MSLKKSIFFFFIFPTNSPHPPNPRGECTESLRRRISELETECKKLTLDIKVKEDLIHELELKVQVSIIHKVHVDAAK